MTRAILHSDLNSFYASVETMLNPALRGKAVAVCGSTEDRHGIVLAKSELAKKAGVKTGMVNWEAKRCCPNLIMVAPQYEQYLKYSKLTRAIYQRYTDLVEPFGMLREYLGALPDDVSEVRSIDIEAFASRCLGLNVAYTRLSDTGDILGLTTYADVDVELDRYMDKQTITVPKNTILIDDSLVKPVSRPDVNRGRRRFTISHECSHQILFRREPVERQKVLLRQYSGRSYSLRELVTKEDWSEWQANALGAALLMPPVSIRLLMAKHGNRRLICYDNHFASNDKLVLSHLCRVLDVSKAALVIRLRQLGFIEDKPFSEFVDPLEVVKDESDS